MISIFHVVPYDVDMVPYDSKHVYGVILYIFTVSLCGRTNVSSTAEMN